MLTELTVYRLCTVPHDVYTVVQVSKIGDTILSIIQNSNFDACTTVYIDIPEGYVGAAGDVHAG